ncbi:MAG: hypothetical protein M3Y72_00600 [Acidobacteriota bacterium]|nr:hypothetical protein [Acidobacteriota bacterium]
MSASTLSYTLAAGSDLITFTLPQQPVPVACTFATDCFGVDPANLAVDGSPVTGGVVNFYTPAQSGGLTILDGSTLLVNNGAPGNLQLFSGSLSAPTLNAYSNLQLVASSYGSPTYDEGFLLNATSSTTATPEPSVVFLTLLGGLVLLIAYPRLRSTIH